MSSKDFKITVRGEAELFLPAERGSLSFRVAHTSRDKQDVTKQVIPTVRRAEEILRSFSPKGQTADDTNAAAVDYWSRSSLSESSNIRWDSAKQCNLPPEYTTSVKFQSHWQRFNKISTFITAITELPHVTTEDVKWILTEQEKQSHRVELRDLAARNAHEKALQYAKALGFGSVTPLSLDDSVVTVLTSSAKGGVRPSRKLESAAKNMAQRADEWETVEDASFDYHPEDVQMTLSIDAVFLAVR